MIFTYGHRNVVRSVAGGLTRSGSVDGYVWEALSVAEPELTAQTKVIARSEWLGFPQWSRGRIAWTTRPFRRAGLPFWLSRTIHSASRR